CPWHAGPCATRRSATARTAGLAGNRPDDPRPGHQDRAVPPALLVAAGPRRRTGTSERAALGAGHQGLLLPAAAPLVRTVRTGAEHTRCAAHRSARRRCHPVGFLAGPAAA